MTNKQERYFVVSEAELERLVKESLNCGYNTGGLSESEAACRAREVLSVPAYYGVHSWVELPPVVDSEGIPK